MTPEIPNEELPIFEAAKLGATTMLSQNLVATFDGIAKLAIRASAEFADGDNDQTVLQKIQKAHSMVTLIIDDAMRGLSEATFTVMSYVTVSVLASENEED